MSQQLSDDQISTQLEVCADELEKLSDWEKNFVESIADQFGRFGKISPKQEEILKQIYDKVV